MRAARLGFLVLASAWVALLVAAPQSAAGIPLSAFAYAFGSLVCHQRPERSFHLNAAQIPVCARCFGLYLGAAIGVIATIRVAGLKPWVTPPALRALVIAAAIPTVITWLLEIVGLWPFSNAARFAAALPLGAAVAVTVNYSECAQPRQTGPSPPRIPI